MLVFKGKVAASGVNAFDFMLVRCVVVFVCASIGLLIFQKPVWPDSLKENKSNKNIFWLRQLAGNFAYFSNTLTMSLLPLGITMILFNTAPFWSVLFGKLINGASISGV